MSPNRRQVRGAGGSLSVRRPRLSELRACACLIASTEPWTRYGVTAARAHAMLRGAWARREPLLVAVEGGRIAGIVWFLYRGAFAHSGYVRWIGVDARARGRGIGRRLMEEVERRVFRRGPNVFLLVSGFNRSAQRFYQRLGYRRVGAIPNYVLPGVVELIFRKSRGPVGAYGPRRTLRRSQDGSARIASGGRRTHPRRGV